MHRQGAAAALLCRTVEKLDDTADPTTRIGDHGPGELGDLTGAQARLGGEQEEEAVALGVAAPAGMAKGNSELPRGEGLGLAS
jgi:hypothetical protein